MKPLLMKFGGTSVGSPEAIRRSAHLVTSQIGIYDGIVVVVSAMNGVTNLLIDSARQAAHQSLHQNEELIQSFYERHARQIEALQFDLEEKKHLFKKLDQAASQFRTVLTSIHRLKYLEPALQDRAAALGERMCAPILAALLRQHRVLACEIDASQLIVTDESYTQAAVQLDDTNRNITAQIWPLLENGIVPVVTGFIGASPSGHVTTLGRGASDYSATILAAGLNAAEIWNWTDVDGVFNADPRLVPQAKVYSDLSYVMMSTLAKFGAKVLHPETLNPVANLGIPLRVRSSFNPDSSGTLIQSEQPLQSVSPLAIVSKSDLLLVEIVNSFFPDEQEPAGFSLESRDPQFQGCFAISSEQEHVLADLTSTKHIRKTNNTSLVTVIGDALPVETVISILQIAGLTVLASRINPLDSCTSVVVRGEDTALAVQVLYECLIEKAACESEVNLQTPARSALLEFTKEKFNIPAKISA